MESTIQQSQNTVKRILYATDFSPQSDVAFSYASALARRYGAKISAVHVISISPLQNASPTQAWSAVVAQAVREAQASLALREPGWKEVVHESSIRRGDTWAELSKVVCEEHIDMIVVGTHGRTGVSKALLGSVAEKIFRHAQCPVLTIGPNVCGEPESVANLHTILYPTDFSVDSLAALPYAISLARQDQARLYFLHVMGNRDQDEVSLKARLQNLIPQDEKLFCEPKIFLQFGQAAPAILEMAEELAVDLIVLGPRKQSGLPGTMGTAYTVVTQALCPVLTVRG